MHDNDLGTIRVPHGTQKAQYVKHIKLTTLERGHFDFLEIRQQLTVDQNYYYQKVRFTKFFLKVFTLKTISANPTNVFVHFS